MHYNNAASVETKFSTSFSRLKLKLFKELFSWLLWLIKTLKLCLPQPQFLTSTMYFESPRRRSIVIGLQCSTWTKTWTVLPSHHQCLLMWWLLYKSQFFVTDDKYRLTILPLLPLHPRYSSFRWNLRSSRLSRLPPICCSCCCSTARRKLLDRWFLDLSRSNAALENLFCTKKCRQNLCRWRNGKHLLVISQTRCIFYRRGAAPKPAL